MSGAQGDFPAFVPGPGSASVPGSLTDVNLNNAFSTKIDKSAINAPSGVPGTDLSNTISAQKVIGTGSSAPLPLANAIDLYPENFGAKGDGVTDDTAAINAYIAYVKTTQPATSAAHLCYHFKPKSVYLISSSLKFGYVFSSGNNPTFSIFGNGAVVTGTTSGLPMLDCINGGFGCKIENLYVVGAQGGTQTCGILYGYSLGVAGGQYGFSSGFTLFNMTIKGWFAYACEFNRGADTSLNLRGILTNQSTTNCGIEIGDSGFVTIVDAQGLWPITSSIDTLQPLAQSNPILYTKVKSRDSSVGGSPYWFDTNVAIDFSGYANSVGATESPIAVIYVLQTLQGGYPFIRWDFHCERNTSLNHIFYWHTQASPTITSVIYSSFFWSDPGLEAEVSALGCDASITYVRLSNVDWDLEFQTVAPLFDVPSKYLISGKISNLPSTGWNAPKVFNGLFYGVGAPTGYTWGGGFALYFDRNASGDFSFVGTDGLTLANASVTGTVTFNAQKIDMVQTAGQIASGGTLTVSAGANEVWFQAATAGAAITIAALPVPPVANGQVATLDLVVQNGSASCTVTWPSGIVGPALPSSLVAGDVVRLKYHYGSGWQHALSV